MKSQHAREEQALIIGTALAVFVGVLVLCAVVMGAVGLATGTPVDRTAGPAAPWALAAAALAAGAHLVRHRR